MDLSWLGGATSPEGQLLLGATGNLIGNLATQAVNALLAAGTRAMRRHFQPPAERQALDQAVAQALAVTIAWLTPDKDQADHLATLLGAWLQREAVAEQLYRLIEPTPDQELDLPLLTAEFIAAGWEPALLSDHHRFDQIVATLATAFANAAAQQPLLQGAIQIGALRAMVTRLDQLVQSSVQQSDLLQQIAATLERFHPLSLEAQEQSYLRKLYQDCNALPLARDDRAALDDRPRPRLQRVYVELRLTEGPTLGLVLDRLGIQQRPARQQARRVFQRAWQETGRPVDNPGEDAEPMAPATRRRSAKALDTPDQAAESWVLAQPSFSAEKQAEIAKQLNVKKEQLAAALANRTPLEALQAQQWPQIVLLGDPGSGKSTLTQRLAALLAAVGSADPKRLADLAEPEVAELTVILNYLGRQVLPVRVVLNRWAQQLTPAAIGCADDLINECVRLIGQVGHVALLKEHFQARLYTTPPTVLLLLDGLDEVTDEGKRSTLLAAIADFQRAHEATPMILTCRVRPYQSWQKSGQALSLPAYTLAPLDPPAIAQFLQRWHAELVSAGLYQTQQAEQAERQLLAAINDHSRRELGEMAGTPLLLTMMARVNYQRGLPNSRAELYELFVNQLLYEWERQKQDTRGQPTSLEALLQSANVTQGSLTRALNELAYTIHSQAATANANDDATHDTVDIPVSQLEGALKQIHPSTRRGERADWAAEVLDLIADRSGLINAIDTTKGAERYKFSHRTFQEYLAARWLATGATKEKLEKFKLHLAAEGWREALLLGIGHLVAAPFNNYDDALLVIDALLSAAVQEGETARQLVLLGEAYARLLGPQRAQEAGNRKAAERVADQLPPLLRTTMQQQELPPRLRLEAGRLLDDLGHLPADLDDLVTINAARTLGVEFKIGKYPVTNHQYRRFVEAGGYGDAQWWSEEGLRYKKKRRWQEPRWWDDARFNRAGQPVVGISWVEAEAYCAWLTVQWRKAGKIREEQGKAEVVRLPTRAEWEAAARSKHGQEYPWGATDFDPACANTKESNLGQTTPVDMYPAGRSADGVWDMAGNVFEWTADRREEDKDRAWLKGGSWHWDKYYAKSSAAADGLVWDDRNLIAGFRVVVVPLSR
jgi:energy-coupling factor transporter ATP-binding protein EcfA2